jgi:hypothetical protein
MSLRSVIRWRGIHSLLGCALGVLAAGGCSATAREGTDSSTHWTYCKTTDDCSGAPGAHECREGRCVDVAPVITDSGTAGHATGGAPGTGGVRATASGGSTSVMPRLDAGSSTGGREPSPVDAEVPEGGAHDAQVPVGLTACATNSDCALVNATCCGVCGEPGDADKAAINATHVEDWHGMVCSGGACPPCVALDGPYEALCENGQCVVKNIGQEKECLGDQDCAVRSKDCCPCGDLGRNDIAAVNSSVAFPACTVSCPACPGGAHYPELQARCYLSGGYCVLE